MNLKERVNTVKKSIPKMTKVVLDPTIDGWCMQNDSGSIKLCYTLGKLYNTISYECKVSCFGITLAHEEFVICSNDPLLPYDQWHDLSDSFYSIIRVGIRHEE